jgi:DNA recombination protein RmuC
MDTIWVAVFLLVALGLGALMGWLAGRRLGSRELTAWIEPLQQERARLGEELRAAEIGLAQTRERLDAERVAAAEKLQAFDSTEKRLREAFGALASDALQRNNQSFLDLAKSKLEEAGTKAQGDLEARKKEVEGLVTPIKEALKGLDGQVKELETKRVQAYTQITTQIGQLATSQENLQRETANLVKALRSPAARGRWGEIQLRRVVEMVGMLEYCDFTQQESVETDDGRLRPDMVVRLPGGACVVVDAKAPLAAYLEALEAQDDAVRGERLKDHARQVRTHLAKLGAKSYWEQFEPSPQFVVLFLPSETFFGAALQEDPGLIEEGVQQHVIVATPTTLIALLRAVAYGWQNERVRQNAEEIRQLGNDLYVRITRFVEHLSSLRKGLSTAVDAYDKTVASLESRVLPQARRFRDLGTSNADEIPSVPPLGRTLRVIDVPELTEATAQPPTLESESLATPDSTE